MRPESAQEQHDRMMEERRPLKLDLQYLKDSMEENKKNFLSVTSSSPRDFVELTMQKHGLTEKEAQEHLEAFGA